ncbi:right-handed parallel beta-helix repeat-containing protein [uncultured Methanobrevibacter sp.]|uniref:right-handed parallel beta-helix repeat-containing protein n=1 Tax=uncultured Methanobrevibacter sp. TaxID=253161 RepID=UPI002629E5BE|nr:right-handed parallel beta-helix repeat-containing protein [uncultured Methanobrevibacter sp.]
MALSTQHNFQYLDDLIKNNKDILLDCDITLQKGEEEIFPQGIEIAGDIVIDGGGFAIDACESSRIFNILCGNVTIKNVIFKNAFHDEDGGAIKHLQGDLNLINCTFIDNFSKTGGSAIFCEMESKVTLRDCGFFGNSADEVGCIYNFNGIVNVFDCEFSKNKNSSILNQRRGRLLVRNCEFKANEAENGAGIANFGKCDVFDTCFEGNVATQNGGAINTQSRSLLNVSNSRFIRNSAGSDGGAIINFSRAKIDGCLFLNNKSDNHGGALSNQKKSRISLSKSDFIANSSVKTGGAILNWGIIDADGLKLENNTVKEFGGAIFNQEDSILKITRSEFGQNSSQYSGGAIMNWAGLTVNDVSFKGNSSNLGGAINSSKKASTTVIKSEFERNSALSGSAIFNNSADSIIFDCEFANHFDDNAIYNFKTISIFDSRFHDNHCKNIIFNDEDAHLKVLGGEFRANFSGISAIYNAGEQCIINKSTFDENKSNITFPDIYNRTYMIISALKLNSKQRTVLNKGVLDVKKMSAGQIRLSIKNIKTLNDFSKIVISRFDFSHLDRLVNSKPKLTLTRDYCLEKYESDFYEGGIEIKNDNLILDSQGHIIDGRNKTRIFIINASNVVLKNITFKNGLFSNNMDRYASGGGAVHVLKGCSVRLENCRFIENASSSNGGAIFNDGEITSINSKFIKNKSKSFGGAIDNKSTLTTSNDEFDGNSSRIGGAIYNRGHLSINSIDLKGNESHFNQDIYNANVIESDDDELFLDSIFNSSKIRLRHVDVKSFAHLADKIQNSNEIKLEHDFVFDYPSDYLLKHHFDIKKDLVIDGCNHTIEYNLLDHENFIISGGGSSSLFRIRENDVRVVLKNIIFKNCYSNGRDIIENEGNLIIENCKFINTRLTSDNAFINNKNTLTVANSYFSNNVASGQSVIVSSCKLDISNSLFINNNSHAIGSCISNSGKASINHSAFKSNNTKNKASCIYNESDASLKLFDVDFIHNDADIDGGAIYNYGEIDIDDSRFVGNLARDEGGVINNRTSGDIKIKNSEFLENESKTNGGAIFSYGKVVASGCIFKENMAKIRAGAIEHTRPLDMRLKTHLKVSDCEFIDNRSPDKNAVYGYEGGDVKLVRCKFR